MVKYFLILILLILHHVTMAQRPVMGRRLEFLSIDEVGSGTQAIGMAQAVTGYIRGADAIYYNPAGMTYIQKTDITTSFNFKYTQPEFRYDTLTSLKSYRSQIGGSSFTLNQFATAFPLHLGNDEQVTMTFGYGYRQLTSWAGKFVDTEELKPATPGTTPPRFDYNYINKNNPNLNSFGFAMRSFYGFSFGLTYNIIGGKTTQEITTNLNGLVFADTNYNRSRDIKLSGRYTEFGMMFHPIKYISLGVRWRAPYQLSTDTINNNTSFSQSVTYQMPNFFSVGIAGKPKKNLAITVDYRQENWTNVRQMSGSDKLKINNPNFRTLHYGSIGVHVGVGIFGYRYKPLFYKDANGKEIATHTIALGVMSKSASKFKLCMEVEYIPEHTVSTNLHHKMHQQVISFLINTGFTIGGKNNEDENWQ
ncbi:MAG: hypothetical protein NZM38_08550 [Cytophagales bacterium]|nr:hypothetical protein [Cytophagales bacterium]MDW8384808.1 hypothetical protein [Flammeovirgaceae bacterium]